MTTEHLGGAYPGGDGNTIMQDVWGFLVINYEVKSVLDVGCGYGQGLKWFLDHSISGLGIDGFPDAIKNNLCPGNVMLHDFCDGPPALEHGYDLGWSAEFLEHVEEKYVPNIMAAFAGCGHVCVTHGEPGQNGHHHVNCQDDDYWVERFREHGFEYLADETRKLRLSDRWHAPWGRRSLMLFRNERTKGTEGT